MAAQFAMRISLESNSSGDYEITVDDELEKRQDRESFATRKMAPACPSGAPKSRLPQAARSGFAEELRRVEGVFDAWNEEEKKLALWKLMVSLNSGEARFDLLCKLEDSLKRDPFSHLPGEISVHILGFLSRKDLARAAQVCSLWKSLAYDHTLLIERIKMGSMYCLSCNTFLGRETDIVSRKYRLDFSLAFVIGALCNVELGEEEEAEHPDGKFRVSKAFCRCCKSKLGIKYLESLSPEGAGKVGKFLVKKKTLYFPGEPAHHVVLACKGCKSSVSKDQDIMDWNYVLRGGEAYLFSRMFNVQLGSPTQVTYSTGNYTVADVFCCSCNANLGVKYIEAPSAKNAYKVGAYLVEKPKLQVVTLSTAALRTPSEAKRERSRGLLSSFMSLLRK